MSRSEVKEERNFADHLNAVTNHNEIIRTLNCIDIMRAFTEVKINNGATTDDTQQDETELIWKNLTS